MRLRKTVICLSLAVCALFAGALVSVAEDKYQDLQLFAKVLNLVQQYYVEEVDVKKLIYGGIKGMLRELDPHTNFLPPEIYKEFESETTGEFGGIGIEITVQNGILTIISPIEDTPAWKAGIKAGDKVVEIDGESTKGFSLVEAAQKMKGKRGSKIRLGIFREGFDKPKEFSIERGIVKIKSSKYTDLTDGYAYVRLTSFIENSASDMQKELKEHQKKYGHIKGLILDLRHNPGGLLDQAVQVSDLFLEQGTIVSTMGRNKKEKEVLYAKKAGTLEEFPLILLIDEYSASASEIVAGALQDNRRALIMGRRSFGKGSVQSVVKLGDGSGLKLTVGRYYTPSGKSIQAEGIHPDIELPEIDAEALEQALVKKEVHRERDMQGHLLGEEESEAEKAAEKLDQGKRSVSERARKRSAAPFWWTEAEKPNHELSPREKLLKDDFQVQQAYNYLKAWKTLDDYRLTPVAQAEPTVTVEAARKTEQALVPPKGPKAKEKPDSKAAKPLPPKEIPVKESDKSPDEEE
jgi:carboxyl-terminal processing protease